MESVAVPIPSGTLKPEMHNIVAPISRFIPAPCHKPGPELSKANAVYKPFCEEPPPYPDNEEIPINEFPAVLVERPIGQVKEVLSPSTQVLSTQSKKLFSKSQRL